MVSNEIDLAILLGRVESLEKQNRRFRRLGFVGFILLFLGLIMGQSHPTAGLVAVGQFVLKDDEGHDRFTLLVDKNDRVTMRFQDKDGTVRALLNADPKGDCSLELNGIEGKKRASLIAAKDFGNSMLSLCDRKGKQKAMMGVMLRGIPALTMADDEGARRVSVAVSPEGQVLMQALDANGKVLWQPSIQ